ncbi:MAG: zinc ribbon domain-containing protein [Lautropia sp.]|nr:zinc ribbon domain-containing protein [Lautropia sp.]
MPIYAYRCSDCGFQKDVLQKFSDPPLTVCPACGHDSFGKQLTAPAFQLKGTGWYVTDFRDNGKKPADGKGAAAGEPASGNTASGDAGQAPAPAPAPAAPAPAPAPSAGSAS